ncbi:MAG: ABC transporter ATP-binding protein [Acidobacteriota bacterium]
MIRIKGLSFYRQKQILKNIDLNLEDNKLTIMFGPNGAGKTTILKIISGIIKDFDGNIFINDKNIKHISRKELAKYISFQPQSEEFLLPISVKDVLMSGRYPYKKLFYDYDRKDQDIYEECIEKFNISEITGQDINTLSSGERRRVLIASAYIQDVPVLLFDEPFANLDPEGVVDLKEIFSELKKSGKTILVVSHNLEPLYPITDNIIALRGGEVLYSGKKQNTAEILQRTFKLDFISLEHKKREIFIPYEKQD